VSVPVIAFLPSLQSFLKGMAAGGGCAHRPVFTPARIARRIRTFECQASRVKSGKMHETDLSCRNLFFRERTGTAGSAIDECEESAI
jgi:hypothetical protein